MIQRDREIDFPRGCYWLSEDGRVYSAPLQRLVTVADSGFVSFLASGSIATFWPRDDAGAQSDAALLAVISPYGLTIG